MIFFWKRLFGKGITLEMNGLTLTAEESQLLRNAHRRCKDKRAADRIKAIYSLGNGQSAEDVMSILMVDEETLRNYTARGQKMRFS